MHHSAEIFNVYYVIMVFMEKPNLDPSNSEDTQEVKRRIGKFALSETEDWRHKHVSWLAQEYLSSESDFIKYGYNRLDTMSYEEFSKWEDDASVYFEEMTKEASKLRLNRYQRDYLEHIKSTITPWQSIEACSGKWYYLRQAALVNAIDQSNDPNKNADLSAIDDTYRHVGEHLYYLHDTDERDVYKRRAEQRSAHNRLINHLNHLNDLARKYGVRPLTFRNFEDNDFIYYRSLDKDGCTDARAEYDRGSVEGYFRRAFSSDYDKADRGGRSNQRAS